MSSLPSPTLQATVNRVEYAAGGVLQMLALPLVMLLLLANVLGAQHVLVSKRGLAGSLLVYLAISLAFLVPTVVYSIFMSYSTWLSPAGVRFDVHWLFWTGVWTIAATDCIANATLFLTLDRCLTILSPLKYPKTIYQRLLNGLDVLTSLLIYIGFVVLVLVEELPLDAEAAAKCLNHPCTATKVHYKYHVIFGLGQGVLNLFVGTVFLGLLRQKTVTVQSDENGSALIKINAARNRVVLMTILSEIVLKILPSLATFLVNNFTSLLISNYLGWIIMFLSSVDTFIVSVYYSVVLIKWPELIRWTMAKFGKNSGHQNQINTLGFSQQNNNTKEQRLFTRVQNTRRAAS